MKKALAAIFASSIITITGCATTNSTPYKASINNVVAIQQSLGSKNVRVGSVTPAQGLDENPTCRLMGPINVSPGKSTAQYIQEAFQEELYMAKAYSPSSNVVINGVIKELKFSSVSPAYWQISMAVSSNKSNGYTATVKYPFTTSFDAYSACNNVANAFGPAVQKLLEKVVTNPQFASLAK